MTKPTEEKPAVDLREAGRKGGIRSGEVRRKKRNRGWEDAFLDAADADPEGFAQKLLASSNAMVAVKGLELAQAAKRAKDEIRKLDLEQREAEVVQRERNVQSTADWLEMASRKRDRLLAEAEELERQRDELRVAIAREAEAHDFELVED